VGGEIPSRLFVYPKDKAIKQFGRFFIIGLYDVCHLKLRKEIIWADI